MRSCSLTKRDFALEEAIKIIKLLWKKDKKVDFTGEIWKLNDAVLSLKPYKRNKAPPIWIAAHGPKMLKLTGELGDGWLPIGPNPEEYKSKLEKIRSTAKKEDRDPDKITPALFLYVIIDENKDECDKLLSSPLVKNLMLACSDKDFKKISSR